MAWDNAVVTNNGVALLGQVLMGSVLIIDAAAAGEGTVTPSALMAQTSLKNQKQSFSNIKSIDVARGKKIEIRMTSQGSTGYQMQQVGIFAHIGNAAPVLFAILQDTLGLPMPSYNEMPDFALNFFSVVDFSNEASFSVTVDTSALVNVGQLNEEMKKATAHTDAEIVKVMSTMADIAKSIPLSDVSDTAITHRNSFRGKNLGTAVTDAQKAAIRNGSFEDLWLGDYWVIDGRTWRIADFNYWLNCGDIAVPPNHLVIMPDKCLYNYQMNETNITTGGYIGSKMYTAGLAQAKTLANSAFPSMVLSHRELLVNAVTNGYPSAGAWYDSTVELPNEIMMYGSCIFTPACDGVVIPYLYTINNSQLALMAACPRFIKTRETYCLRDVVSAARFALVGSGGNASCDDASNSFGVRPVFAIG